MEFEPYREWKPKKKSRGREIKGWYFPPEVVRLFLAREIGPRDLVVLGTIDTLTRTYPNKVTVPCFASNKRIGEMVGLQPRRVSDIVGTLEAIGLIKRFTKADQKHNKREQRYLLPKWRYCKGWKISLRRR